MNSLKSLITVAILGAVGVGLYMKINSMPDPKPPKDFASSWVEPPAIDMGGDLKNPLGSIPGTPDISGSTTPGGSAPAFSTTPPGGTAPVYVPASGSGGPPPINSSSGSSITTPDSMPVSANVELPATTGMGSNTAFPSSTTDPFSTHITGGPSTNNSQFGVTPATNHTVPLNTAPQNVSADNNQFNSSTGLGNITASSNSESLFYRTEHATFDEAWAEARVLLSQKNLASAHLLLSAWYNHPTLRPAEKEALMDLLSGLAGTVIYSPEHHLEQPYTPAAGETLDQIARRYQVSPELLAKINGITPMQTLNPAQPLKVLRGPFGAQIDAAQQEMVLVLGGRYAGKFQIGLGRERSDIAGRYEVSRKVANPPYIGPDRTIEPGDPANPLGSHFLKLIKPLENEAAATFGIHGTNASGNLNGDDARGYIRLSQRDISDCYDILSEKSQVVIRR